jgi:hypothetical protein
MSTGPSKSRSHRENITYPRLEKPRFLFFKGSAGTTATPVVAAAALVSARRRCRSTRHPLRRARAPAPLIARRRVPPYPPRAPVPLPPLRPLATGVGNSTSRWGGGTPPVALFFLLLRRVLRHRRGGALAAHAAPIPHSPAPSAPDAGFSSSSRAPPAPAPVVTRRGRPPGPGALVDLITRHPRSLSAKSTR